MYVCNLNVKLERILCYKCTAGAAAALPYMREYDVRRREHVAHHLYQPYSATVDGMMRHSHGMHGISQYLHSSNRQFYI